MNKLTTPVSIEKISSIRRHLHQHPELSQKEKGTADYLAGLMKELHPKMLLKGLGGTGLAVVFDSGADGPTVLLRAELDALPIEESNDFAHRSVQSLVSHKCGHDGHMAALVGIAESITKNPIPSGRAILLFQPAEEIGAGAEQVLEDEQFEQLLPIDYVFSFHNLPGFPLGTVVSKRGPFTAAVQSLIIRLEGKTAHAGEPENGINPAQAIAEILKKAELLTINEQESPDFAVLTPVHLKLGEPAYGVSAGKGEVHLTIRTWTEEKMRRLSSQLLQYLGELALQHRLSLETEWTNVFRTNRNDDESVDIVNQAAEENGFPLIIREVPFKWGEDFGAFTQRFRGAMFGLGSGENHPALHNPDYDFPDELLPTGMNMYRKILDIILG